MIQRLVRVACLGVLAVMFVGCETYKHGYTSPSYAPANIKRVYVFKDPESKEKQKRAANIIASLAKRGIEAQLVEPGATPPANMDAYVSCVDHWSWDLTMYLDSMQLELHDAQNGQLLSSARYKQNLFMHYYPRPERIVDDLVGQLLGEPPPKRASKQRPPEK